MPMILKEDVLERLLRLLAKEVQKDMSGFKFIMESKAIFQTTYSRLEAYFQSKDIPFYKKGVSLGSMTLLPGSLMFQGDTSLFPSGLYFVYPETENEVIIYFFMYREDDLRSSPHYIICYKDQVSLDALLEGYRQYSAGVDRSDSKVYVYGGRDIERPDVTWDEVILPASMKDDIRRNVEGFLSGAETYHRLGIPYKRGLLFTGPPGNGKTMLLKVIAANYPEWKSMYFKPNVKSDDDDINDVFEKADELAPSIICFEDIDSLFRGGITLSNFLNKLDGFEERNGTLILATTNHPEEIDEALTSRPSRFDRVWVISNPDYDSRRVFMESFFTPCCSRDLLDALAEETEGFSMAYLKELYVTAAILAMNKGIDSPGEREIMESLEVLSSQIKGAKKSFVDVNKARKIGFGL